MKDFGLKKLYYSISEVSKITGLEQYILRYWESEFDILKPGKNRAGNRIYTNKDINLILRIKKLLRDEKYTIEGAKKILEEESTGIAPEQTQEVKPTKPITKVNANINSLKNDLEEVKQFLLDLQSKI
ncbi:transcriptional regulator, merr family [hydrocarbon metagenome]|uniref:Transcriptional regulator, merr family n=1 Tax=hydrocarbon metagenome TaxID=938273 RepID=A0A0W8FXP2_9ZZZZ